MNLHAVMFREDATVDDQKVPIYVIRCLEHEFAASGLDEETALERLGATIACELEIMQDLGHSITDLLPAHESYQQLWNRRTEVIEREVTGTGIRLYIARTA